MCVELCFNSASPRWFNFSLANQWRYVCSGYCTSAAAATRLPDSAA